MSAGKHTLPAPLIAGICWIEVGGDPSVLDTVAHAVRSFDWSGPAWTDRRVMTHRPERTSMGAVSMQLRTAAATLGLDASKMTAADWTRIANSLTENRSNIELVARHLVQLLRRDDLGSDLPEISNYEVRIVGARYNRGMSAPLKVIERHTSYGNLIVKLWPRLQELLR